MVYLKKLGDPEWSLSLFLQKIKVFYEDTVFDAKVIKVIGMGIARCLGSPSRLYSYVFVLS